MELRTEANEHEPKAPKLIVDSDGKPYYHIPIDYRKIRAAVHRYFVIEVGDID